MIRPVVTFAQSPRGVRMLAAGAVLVCAAAIGLQPEAATLVLGALVALAVLLFLIRHPIVGVGLCATLVLSGGLSQLLQGSLFQRLYTITFVLTALAYAHQLYANRALLREWLRIRLSDVLIAALVVIAALSLGVAGRFDTATDRLSLLLRGAAVLLLITRAVRTRDDLIVVGGFILVGGLLQALSTWTGSAFQSSDGNDVQRLSGNLKDANAFAGALLPVVPWAFFFAFYGRGVMRLLGAVGLVVVPMALLGSISRTALIVLVLIALFWPLFSTGRMAARLRYGLISLVVISMAITLYWEPILTRWGSLREWISDNPVTYVVDDDGGRSDLWQVAWEITQDHPVLGMGIGNGSVEMGQRTNRYTRFYAHNMYLNVAIDMGLLGLAAFVALIAAAYFAAARTLLHVASDRDRGLCATVLAGLISWTAFGMTLNTEYQNYAYCLLGLAFATAALLMRAEAEHSSASAGPAAAARSPR